MLSKCLLFDTNGHFEHFGYRLLPLGVVADERVVLQRVPDPLDIDILKVSRALLPEKSAVRAPENHSDPG